MNALVEPTAPYANSAYRSTAIPAQPPHKWPQDANRTSPTRTQLCWAITPIWSLGRMWMLSCSPVCVIIWTKKKMTLYQSKALELR